MLTTKTIGNKIAEARKKVNISQAQLAERLFISSQAVGKWERGESMPDIITFNNLAEILGVDLNYFSESEAKTWSGSDAQEIPDRQSDNPHSDKKRPDWDMSRGNWVDADFSGLKNLHEKFSSSNMQRCRFIGSNLSKLILKSNNIDSCDFSGSDISNSSFQNSHLNKDVFKDCSLKETEFSRSFFNICDFSGVTFKGTKSTECYFSGCDFTGTDFTEVIINSGGFTGIVKSNDNEKNTISNAVWNRTSFIGTHIADLVLTGTLEDCSFENCAFTRVTFRNATLVNTFFKNNKKLKSVRFLDCSADRITYEFLKQGNADLSGIKLIS